MNDNELKKNALELAILIRELKFLRLKELNDEAMDTFGKLFIDLTIDEVKESSINIRREYKRFERKLFLSMAK